MKVYVLEVGAYEQRGVEGIFASPELAMAACNKGTWTRTVWQGEPDWQNWTNNWGDGAEISEAELVTGGPSRSADQVIVQEKNPQPRAKGWQPWVSRRATTTEADAIQASKQTDVGAMLAES